MLATIAPPPTRGLPPDIAHWQARGWVGTTPTRRGDMAVFRNDHGALTQSLLAYGEWAEREIAFCGRFVGRGDTVLDVGAYIGTHALAFAELVGPAGRVHCFEAQPASFALLAHNIVSNAAWQVVTGNAVIGAAAAERGIAIDTIDISAPSSFGSTQAALGGFCRDPARVAAVALDALDLTSCALLKIDVEGMEDEVLAGAARLICATEPLIYSECNSVDAGSRVAAVLRAGGYSVWMHVADAYNPRNWRGNPNNIFGPCREAALVGVPPRLRTRCEAIAADDGEDFFEIETLDDLVAGLLLKPQYRREVLRFTSAVGAAARHG